MKLTLKVIAAAALALGVAAQANALSITPTAPYPTGVYLTATGAGPANPDIAGIYDVTEYYKANVPEKGSGDPVDEEGSLAGSYETAFYNEPDDPQDATISWTGPSYITGSPIYLLVKDGFGTPGWYLFEISEAWDGQEIIELTGFWPGIGAISHVSLFGRTTSVPDGGSMAMLLGAALMGLAAVRRMI